MSYEVEFKKNKTIKNVFFAMTFEVVDVSVF